MSERVTSKNEEELISLRLSLDEFSDGVRSLTQALSRLTAHGGEKCFLHQWFLKKMPCGTVYLSHPLVNVFQKPMRVDYNCNKDLSGFDWEEEVIDDSEALVTEDVQRFEVWSFDVFYSPVWRVPVLYFQIQNSDGSVLSRNKVLKLLSHSCDDSPEDSWNFISQEEHPCTGVPAFFLHPCQTSQRLSTLLMNEAMEGDRKIKTPANLLISWLCMVLPATGFRISPQFFSAVKEEIKTQLN